MGKTEEVLRLIDIFERKIMRAKEKRRLGGILLGELQRDILLLLNEERSVPIKTIINKLKSDPSNLAHSLKRLYYFKNKVALVKRETDRSDMRYVNLSITKAGKKILRKDLEIRTGFLSAVLNINNLTDVEKVTFKTLLKKMISSLNNKTG